MSACNFGVEAYESTAFTKLNDLTCEGLKNDEMILLWTSQFTEEPV